METIATIVSIIVILLTILGVMCMIALLVTLSIIHNGGHLSIGYDEEPKDKNITPSKT